MTLSRRIASFAATLVLSVSATAQSEYAPAAQVRGTVRVWGSAQMQDLMRLWEFGFRRYQPDVHFEEQLRGTISAMGGLYGGAADLALMGREIWPEETMAYTQAAGTAPTGVDVAMGSFDVPTKADALMIFVQRDNPLSSIRFDQLAFLFGCDEHGPPTWSEAGVTGPMARQPVHVYGYTSGNAAARFFQQKVLRGTPWNCALHGFANRQSPGRRRIDSGTQIIDALSADPLGIAIANIHYATPAVKALALSPGPDLPSIPADRSDYAAGRYPLTRTVSIYFRCGPAGGECQPAVREFVRYVLSRQGQQDVRREGAYLPLPAAALDVQRRKLSSMK